MKHFRAKPPIRQRRPRAQELRIQVAVEAVADANALVDVKKTSYFRRTTPAGSPLKRRLDSECPSMRLQPSPDFLGGDASSEGWCAEVAAACALTAISSFSILSASRFCVSEGQDVPPANSDQLGTLDHGAHTPRDSGVPQKHTAGSKAGGTSHAGVKHEEEVDIVSSSDVESKWYGKKRRSDLELPTSKESALPLPTRSRGAYIAAQKMLSPKTALLSAALHEEESIGEADVRPGLSKRRRCSAAALLLQKVRLKKD